ncbi:MAG: extracellular solute-binding protein [Chloroflexi bacterium]|nr:extracellular solute-binding protein [Chloroflexota bacterium]
MSNNSFVRKFTRRHWLKLALGAGAGAALAACAPKVVKETVVVKEVVKETVEVEKVVKEAVEVEKEVTRVVEKVVEKAVPAPAEKVVIRYWLPPTTEQAYREKMIKEFMDLNPEIEIKMDGADPSKYNEATQLLFKGGTPPDVFWKFNLSMPEMLDNNMIQPYPEDAQNYIMGAYPKSMFLEGINTWEGKLYGFWPVGPKTATRVLYINNKLLDAAGIEPPKTWGEFREAAKKLTEAGKGQSYGLIIGGKSPWDYTALVGILATTAGPMAGVDENTCMDWTAARMTIGDDYLVAALKLCLDMQQEGSLFPGFSTISHTEARAGLANGWAGMYLGGWWDAGAYNTQFPDFDYSIMTPPINDAGRMGYNHGSTFIDRVYVSKEAKHLDAIAKFLKFKFGPAYQRGWARNGWFTTLPEANEPDNIADPKVQALFKISEDIRTVPEPIARNAQQAKVTAERKALHPNWGELLGGAFTGQVSLDDYRVQSKDYADKWRAELERAINEVKGRGVNVSIDDWIFPNWDPNKDYTTDMYGAL